MHCVSMGYIVNNYLIPIPFNYNENCLGLNFFVDVTSLTFLPIEDVTRRQFKTVPDNLCRLPA